MANGNRHMKNSFIRFFCTKFTTLKVLELIIYVVSDVFFFFGGGGGLIYVSREKNKKGNRRGFCRIPLLRMSLLITLILKSPVYAKS